MTFMIRLPNFTLHTRGLITTKKGIELAKLSIHITSKAKANPGNSTSFITSLEFIISDCSL